MQPRSGISQAGGILLLIGAILAALGVLMLLGMFVMMTFLENAIGEEEGFPGFMRWVYLVLAVVSVAGAIVGFLAWQKHREGDDRMAGIMGIVASLLPPIQAVILVGGILCLVSPEAKGEMVWQAQAP